MVDRDSYVPLVEATRAALPESTHFGAVAVADIHGKLIAGCGDVQMIGFMRSSSKPLQALPLIEHGGREYFSLTHQEIALTCASHEGTDLHVQVIQGLQEKCGVEEADLLCGCHPTSDKATAAAMLLRGEKPTPNRHNCSGKHSGFLALGNMLHAPKADYVNPNHPVQQEVIRTFAEMCLLEPQEVHIAVDGCSAPTFAVPLLNAAAGIARLCNPHELHAQRAQACRVVTQAMTEYPEMVAGFGVFDTRLMQAGRGKIITKRGAEGYQIIGLLPGACGDGSPALGITIKISDGDRAERARPLVSMEVLRQLGALDEMQMYELREFYTRTLSNWRKIETGELRSCFTLARSLPE